MSKTFYLKKLLFLLSLMLIFSEDILEQLSWQYSTMYVNQPMFQILFRIHQGVQSLPTCHLSTDSKISCALLNNEDSTPKFLNSMVYYYYHDPKNAHQWLSHFSLGNTKFELNSTVIQDTPSQTKSHQKAARYQEQWQRQLDFSLQTGQETPKAQRPRVFSRQPQDSTPRPPALLCLGQVRRSSLHTLPLPTNQEIRAICGQNDVKKLLKIVKI